MVLDPTDLDTRFVNEADHDKAAHDALALSHDSLSDVSADDHHDEAHTLASHSTKAHSELTSVNYNAHHTERSVPSFVPFLTLGAIWNAFYAQPVIEMPAADADCMFRLNFRVPDEWPTGGCDLKIMYSMSAALVYSGKWTITALNATDDWVGQGRNVLDQSTAYDFPSGTTGIVYVKTITLSDADIVPGCSLGVAFQSDAGNTPTLYIMEAWIEP